MGWRSSTPSSSWASCAAGSLGMVDLILTTWRSRACWSSVRWPARWYRPLRMCRLLTMCSCSGLAIQTAGVLRRGEVFAGHAAAEAGGRGNSVVAAG